MNFFALTRSKRHIALAMLMVWLFALGSGVANACLLQTNDAHTHTNTHTNTHESAQLVDEPTTSFGHHDEADNTKESCLKVCDDGTHSLVKLPSDTGDINPGPVSLLTTLWTGSPREITALCRRDNLAIPITGPPLRVRYSRLAL